MKGNADRTHSEKRALIIGVASLDFIGRLEGDLQESTSNPARIRASYGGVARNVAENLARLGQPVSLMTVVGNDQNGTDLLAHTEAAGVDISHVQRSDEFPTGFYLAILNNQGQLAFAVDDMRIMGTLSSDYLHEHEQDFHSADLLFLDANIPVTTLRTIFSLAKKAGILICADPTSASLALRFKPYLSRLHLITPNSTEAAVYSGEAFDSSDRSAALGNARFLVNQGVDIALITLAEFGVCYASSETNGHISAIRTKIVDPTGAGDALTAAVIFALLNDIPLDDAVRLGVSAASLTLRFPGTVDPNLSLERLYDQLLI